MPKYAVEIEYTSKRSKTINVWARDESEAEEKAVDIVLSWDGVDDAEATDVMEE